MSHSLLPCASCDRHVRALSDTCPFCGAARTPVVVPPRPAPRHLSRTMIFAFGTSLALAGCGPEAVPVYGAPAPPDASADVTDASADVTDPGADVLDAADAPAVRYGAPPPPDWC